MRGLIFALLLSGCAHIEWSGDLKSHEERHCRDDFNVPQEKWVYHYGDPLDIIKICRDESGLLFVEACAKQMIDGTCHMWIPKTDAG